MLCFTSLAVRPAAGQYGTLGALLWLAVSAAALVPARLLEPRYFILPVLLLRYITPMPDRRTAWLTTAWSVAIHVAVLWLFLARPFVWPDGSVARFMW